MYVEYFAQSLLFYHKHWGRARHGCYGYSGYESPVWKLLCSNYIVTPSRCHCRALCLCPLLSLSPDHWPTAALRLADYPRLPGHSRGRVICDFLCSPGLTSCDLTTSLSVMYIYPVLCVVAVNRNRMVVSLHGTS
ncbi:hypothetical protein J6590_054124 [Homalodisca vitripennis]|nr:hypothetical protein J6590_054124 [Homalodisca vitripennis]